jgi:hypothetical protein
MGGLFADFDDDARLDLYITDFGPSKLFVRDPGGGFVERAAALGVAAAGRLNARCDPGARTEECLVLSWSAVLTDFDLDGFDELLVVNGETVPGNTPPALYFVRGAAPQYSERSPDLPCMDARGLVATDLDGDGDRDLVIGPADGSLAIFENRGRPAPAASLTVTLRGVASNRDGIGAVVTARTAAGRTLVQPIGASGVIHTASPAEAFFGLGADTIESLTVRWPSGRISELLRPAGRIVVDEP